MKTFFKKYWWLILLFLVVIPLIVEIGITLVPWNGSDDGWLGFWGGYLGSIVAVIGTVLFTIYYSNRQLEINRDAQVQAHIKIAQYEKLIDYETELENFNKVLSNCVNKSIERDEPLKEKEDIINKIKKGHSELELKYEIYSRFVGAERASKIRKIHNSIIETWPKFKWCIEKGQVYPDDNINKSMEKSSSVLEVSVENYREKIVEDCLIKVAKECNNTIEKNLK